MNTEQGGSTWSKLTQYRTARDRGHAEENSS